MDTSRSDELEADTVKAYAATVEWFSDHKPFALDPLVVEWRRYLGENALVADIGCGFGRVIDVLHKLGLSRYIGIDPCTELIELARARYPTNDFRLGTILDLPSVVSEQCDAFLASWSLMHIGRSNIDRNLASIRKVLKPGAAGLILTAYGDRDNVATHRTLPFLPKGHRFLMVEWELETLAPHLEKAGFTIVDPTGTDESMLWITVLAV